MIPLTNPDWVEIEKELCRRSLVQYIKRAWQIIEPVQPYVHGRCIEAIAEHLEAVTRGEIKRLYIAVPPGHMKSLSVACFWPSWEWGPAGFPHYRYVGTSHSLNLATRDNVRTRRIIESAWYQSLWPVKLTSDQNSKLKFENSATGFREAMAFTSLTGARGDRVLMDDVMSSVDADSDAKREAINVVFLEEVPLRLNVPELSAIVNIQQRLHPRDTIGLSIAKEMGYEGLVLPMEFEPENRCVTSIGFSDWRTKPGELLFPERFPREVVERDKKIMGSFAVAAKFQQRPVPREGGMFQRDWFEIVDAAPANMKWVRGWDLAATEKKQGQDPAATAGVKLGKAPDGTFYIGHVVRGQWSAGKVEKAIKNTASQDGHDVIVDLPQDPGQAGKAQIRYLVSGLAGYTVKFNPESGSKEQRAEPLAAQAEAGNVKLIRGAWNETFLDEATIFPAGKRDQIDAASRAFARLTERQVNNSFSGPILLM